MISVDVQLPQGDTLELYQQRQSRLHQASISEEPQFTHHRHWRRQSGTEGFHKQNLLNKLQAHQKCLSLNNINNNYIVDTGSVSPVSAPTLRSSKSRPTTPRNISSFGHGSSAKRRSDPANALSSSANNLANSGSMNINLRNSWGYSISSDVQLPSESACKNPWGSGDVPIILSDEGRASETTDNFSYTYANCDLDNYCEASPNPCHKSGRSERRIGTVLAQSSGGERLVHSRRRSSKDSNKISPIQQSQPLSVHIPVSRHCNTAQAPKITISDKPDTVDLQAFGSSSSNFEAAPSISCPPASSGAITSYSSAPCRAPGMSSIPSPNLLCVVEAEDDLSDWESPVDIDLADPPQRKNRQSSWRKIRSFILWSPFIQVFKKHRYPWIQLAGHQGNFHAGDAGSVLKKLDPREAACFQKLMTDKLREFVPEYRGDVDKNGDTYIQLQDLLCSFSHPCVMDVKMGVRTYLEDELQKARRSPTLRKDMYQKMIEVDNTAPTTEEHEQKAVTKPRYMQWRDEMSSSVELGFRVEGIKKSDGNSSKDFKKTKTREDIVEIVKSFVGENENIVAKYIRRLKDVMHTQETSEFFTSHEVIGSSLLFVHDADENVGVWMIDFGKTEPLPSGVSIDHRSQWNEGNHEDGYLYGLEKLISIFEDVHATLTSSAV